MNEHARLIGVIKVVGTTVTDANDVFLGMVGYTRDDLETGEINWSAITPPEFLRNEITALRESAEHGGFTVPVEKYFVRKDRSWLKALLVRTNVQNAPNTWLGYLVDVTQVLSLEAGLAAHGAPLGESLPPEFYSLLIAELVRERARMLAMMNNTDASIWAVDPELRLLSANQAFFATQFKISGRQIEPGDSVMSSQFPAEMRAQWAEWYARALRGERFTVTSRVDLPDGSRVSEHNLSPIINTPGEIVGVSAVSTNISARTVAREALQASEARFRTLTAASPMGIFLADKEGSFEYANPRLAEIWQTPAELMTELGFLHRVRPEDATIVTTGIADAMALGSPTELECGLLMDDASVRYVRIWIAPIRDNTGLTGCVGTVADITERRQLAQRARQREKMESLGTLAGGIAHDFNNMLSVVLGFADLAMSDAGGQTHIEEHLREIRTASLRARDLVRQILAFSRRAENAWETVDLRAVTAESVRLMRATMPAGISLDSQLPDQPLFVLADATALQQVVVNLCTNAEHAMREYGGGRLTVRLARLGTDEPGRAVLMVSDTGHGMNADVRDRMFEPFFTTKPPGEGTGMGLAVVHGIVSELGGTTAVDSVSGAGATVRVVLPLTSISPSRDDDEEVSMRGEGRILLVEDEPALARFAIKALERAGFDVTYCNNGADALRVFDQQHHATDLVISDIAMPGLTGDRLLRELRSRSPAVPVVLMTGYTELLSPETAASFGASALLFKPLSAVQLITAARKAIANGAAAAL